MKNARDLKRAAALGMTGLLLLSALTGCSDIKPGGAASAPVASNPISQPAEASGNPQTPSNPEPTTNAPTSQPANTSFVAYKLSSTSGSDDGGSGLSATPVTLPPGSKSPARSVLDALANGPDSPLPPGTRVLSVNIDDAAHLATVDFSREFESHFQGGDAREAQAVSSVVETMSQFPNVKRVQILVDGKKLDTLGGNVDISQPLPAQSADAKVNSRDSGSGT